jgi:hypothetical protein
MCLQAAVGIDNFAASPVDTPPGRDSKPKVLRLGNNQAHFWHVQAPLLDFFHLAIKILTIPLKDNTAVYAKE